MGIHNKKKYYDILDKVCLHAIRPYNMYKVIPLQEVENYLVEGQATA